MLPMNKCVVAGFVNTYDYLAETSTEIYNGLETLLSSTSWRRRLRHSNPTSKITCLAVRQPGQARLAAVIAPCRRGRN